MYKLGRIVVKDLRDEDYRMLATASEHGVTRRYWNQGGWKGNQVNTPHCVGYAWAHFVEDGPTTHKGIAPIVKPDYIYREAQLIDDFPGSSYDGTTVRAGAKVLKNIGWISEYKWIHDINTLSSIILSHGPVVVGTWWFSDMYKVENDFIKVGGKASGGHAYLINGVNTKMAKFRIKNSWGLAWGTDGSAYISFEDMEKLLKWDGEACFATENQKKDLTKLDGGV